MGRKRLIDPTEYKLFLERYIKDLYEIDAPMIAGAVERCLQKLECQSTIDAVEVVHGRWRAETEEEQPNIVLRQVVCSVCGGKTNGRYNYCPNCGAKMDLED
jgi:hypothetical protein